MYMYNSYPMITKMNNLILSLIEGKIFHLFSFKLIFK